MFFLKEKAAACYKDMDTWLGKRFMQEMERSYVLVLMLYANVLLSKKLKIYSNCVLLCSLVLYYVL